MTTERDYHDVPFPEGTQPNEPEWTREYIEDLYWYGGLSRVCDAHNAALAAEREKVQRMDDIAKSWHDHTVRCEEELAAERGEREKAEGELSSAKTLARIVELETQLASARAYAAKYTQELRQQLAAEREKVKILEAKLEHMKGDKAFE
jgi:hypothetical protein